MIETLTAELAPTADGAARPVAEHRLVLLKAVADPTRLAVLDSLTRGGARCHCELEEELGLAASRLSFHLTVLKSAGLVASERSGRRVRYHLTEGALDAVRAAVPTLDEAGHPSDACTSGTPNHLEANR